MYINSFIPLNTPPKLGIMMHDSNVETNIVTHTPYNNLCTRNLLYFRMNGNNRNKSISIGSIVISSEIPILGIHGVNNAKKTIRSFIALDICFSLNYLTRNAQYDTVRWNIFINYRVRSNCHIITNRNISHNLTTYIHIHIVPNCRLGVA